KSVRCLDRDPAPLTYADFPGIDRLELTTRAPGPADAIVFLECTDPGRTEVEGLDRYFKINIDHHLGNAMYGDVNWFDESAAACGEMGVDVIQPLEVAWTP